MKIFREIFDFYLNSSMHVALATMSFTLVTILEFNLKMDLNIIGFIGFATISGYNFVKYYGLAKFHHRSLATWLKVIQIFSLICFLLMCFFLFRLNLRTLFYISIFGIITFLYAIPLVPTKIFRDSQKNLRSIGGLKVYIIALVWAGVTVFLPILNAQANFGIEFFLAFIQRFILVLVLMIPFEIRDLQYDSVKLATIPQKIGVRNTKIIGTFLLTSMVFLYYFRDNLSQHQLTVSLVMSLMIMMLVLFSKVKQGKYYSGFFVESLPILWYLLYVVV